MNEPRGYWRIKSGPFDSGTATAMQAALDEASKTGARIVVNNGVELEWVEAETRSQSAPDTLGEQVKP